MRNVIFSGGSFFSLFFVCGLSLACFAAPVDAAADSVVVAYEDSLELKSIELKRGQAADIIVYLASLGDVVEKYLVILRRESDNKRIRTLLSDRYGRVKFKVIPPGTYRVYVSRRVKEDGELSTVKIGDVRLLPAQASR